MIGRTNILLGVLAAVAVALPAGASAATIVVNDDDDDIDVGAPCTLRAAVEAANTNAPFRGCSGDGAGPDTIVLQSDHTYQLDRYNPPEDANVYGDLDITGGGGTTIQSDGPGLATIDGYGSTAPLGSKDRVIDVLTGSGPVALSRVKITNGLVQSGGGGGIRTVAGLTLTDSEVADNHDKLHASVNFPHGGGILVTSGSLSMNRSTVADNSAEAADALALDDARGGGIAFFGSSLTATNSTISGNTAADAAGDASNYSGGGGIYYAGTTMNLTNVTIADNAAPGDVAGDAFGGGIDIEDSGATLGGTILAGNTSPDDPDCTESTAPVVMFASAGNNLIGNTDGCPHTGGSNDLTNVPALLGALSNYGGLTRTHYLNPNSQAIDHGGACPATDQRGFFRGPVAPCDTGAFELNAPASLPPTPINTATPPAAGSPTVAATGQRAAALARCKKKKGKARKKCKKKANRLPL